MLKIVPDTAERWQIEKLVLELEVKLQRYDLSHETK